MAVLSDTDATVLSVSPLAFLRTCASTRKIFRSPGANVSPVHSWTRPLPPQEGSQRSNATYLESTFKTVTFVAVAVPSFVTTISYVRSSFVFTFFSSSLSVMLNSARPEESDDEAALEEKALEATELRNDDEKEDALERLLMVTLELLEETLLAEEEENDEEETIELCDELPIEEMDELPSDERTELLLTLEERSMLLAELEEELDAAARVTGSSKSTAQL